MITIAAVPERRHLITVLLLIVLTSLPGCVIYATAAPEESAVATAPPAAKRDTGAQDEAARLERERAEKERAEKERAEKERADKERADKERADKERADKERADKERADKERADKERAEKERTERERAEKERAEKERAEKERADKAKGPRPFEAIPPGLYPKPGECRLWYSGKPPGQQPKAAPCSTLMGRDKVPAGAFILYGDRAWDSQYDWTAHTPAQGDSVPGVIIQIMKRMR